MVEWKKIGEVTKIIRGNRVTKSDLIDNGLYPVISGGFSPLGFIDRYNRDENTITIAQYGSAGYVDWQKDKFWANDVCYSVYPLEHLNNKFLYYSLINKQHDIYLLRTNAVPAHLPLSKLQDVDIPVPNLKEQERIVGVLDTFTASIDNLKEQIAQRRKQYEYYRDQLLDLEGNEGVERIALKDVCEVINGRAYKQQELLNEGKYRVLRVGNFFSNESWYYSDLNLEDKYYCESGDLLYAWSASFGPHIWKEEKVIYHYHIWKINCGDSLNKRFMYFWLQSEDMKKQAFTNLHGATMAHLTKALMESLMVPVPSLSEQNRIVDILDKFEASIQNLEAQLSQREKQYEYYQNKLLTFE